MIWCIWRLDQLYIRDGNLGMQNVALLRVFGRTISDPKTFGPFLLNDAFSNLV